MAAASVLLVLLVVVIGLICRVLYRYYSEKDTYEEARAAYVEVITEADPAAEEDGESSSAEEDSVCPVQVDFEELQAVNEDIVAWLYCEGTVINYPVCKCDDD